MLTMGIVKGADWGWRSPAVLGCFAAAALLTVLFVASSRRHRSPLLDPALLRIRSFDLAGVATVVAGLGFYAYLLTNILWLQYVWGYDVLRAGLALVPGALVAAVVAALLGPLAERHGYRLFVVPGALVWAGAYVWYHQGWASSRPSGPSGCPARSSAASASAPPSRCWAARRWPRSPAAGTRPRRRSCPAPASSAVCWASRCSWSSSGTPRRRLPSTVLRDGWLLSVAAFVARRSRRAAAGPAHDHAPDEGDGRRRRGPSCTSRTAPAHEPVTAGESAALSDLPLLGGLPAAARARLEARHPAASRRPRASG